MIDTVRRVLGVLGVFGCLLCFLIVATTGDMTVFMLMIALGFFVNWVYPNPWKRNRRS